jgi:pyruvate ferredoxin oxidoreductase delta subunit
MNKPKLTNKDVPNVLPVGPVAHAGVLYDISSGMRTFRPVIDNEKCVKCFQCFMYCPDGTIDRSGDDLEIDYDYCKGCGICAKICPAGCIEMTKENDI